MSRSGLIFFVHGLGGHPTDTWGPFPTLVANDQELAANFDIGYYEYPTGLLHIPLVTKAPSANILADGLRTILDQRYPQYSRIVIAAHSLGGLIARRYLCNEVAAGRALRVEDVLLYAVPGTGSNLANVATLINWRHRQLAQLCSNSDFLVALNSDWHSRDMERRVRATYIYGGSDQVVAPDSARGPIGNDRIWTDPAAGHGSLVKPERASDVAFMVLRNVALAVPPDVDVVRDSESKTRPEPVKQGAMSPRGPFPSRVAGNKQSDQDIAIRMLAMVQVGVFAGLCTLFMAGLFYLILQRTLPPVAFSFGLVPVLLIFFLLWRMFRIARIA